MKIDITRACLNVAVILMILLSGGVFFSELHVNIFLPLYFVVCLTYYSLRSHCVYLDENLLIMVIIVGWYLINNIVLHHDIQSNQYLVIILYCISTFLLISSVSLTEFKFYIYRYFSWLCIISVVIQVLAILSIMPYSVLPEEESHGLKQVALQIFVINCGEGSNIYRLSSIYWEPGQLQIVIFFVLMLFADELADLTKVRDNLRKFSPMLVALFFTLSTTAYLTLAIFVLGIFFFGKDSQLQLWQKITYMSLSLVLIMGLIFSPAVQTKVAQSQDVSEKSSFVVRLADNLALCQMISESPLIGFGEGSKRVSELSEYYGNDTSSNGWLRSTVSNGIPFMALFFFFFYRRIREKYQLARHGVVFLVLFISQCNEFAIYYPYMYFYIFKFLDERNVENINNNCCLQ